MTQTVLPFKLEKTDETITPHAGLALAGEFMAALGVAELLDTCLPGPGSGAGYRPSEFVLPLFLMLTGGGRTLEDLRQIRNDDGLRELLEMDAMPSSDATGDWLRRTGGGEGLRGLAAVNRALLRCELTRDARDEYTLDIDATQIVAKKQEAKRTYKGEIGYMPIVGHLAENGLISGDEFREGNVPPAARNLEFIKYCVEQLPEGKKIGALRADSAAYQAKIFNWCEEHEVKFAIGADLDVAVQETVAAIGDEEWNPYRTGFIAETVHGMNETNKAFRLVVIRRPVQKELFGEEDPREKYTVIASNREESAEQTVAWYNQRGETSENRLKELKIGLGLERMPCGQFAANAVFFRIGALAYNLFVLFKRNALPADWHKHQVQTLRWRVYQTAGKVVSHARSIALKVRCRAHALFEEVRTRCGEIYQEVRARWRETART